MAKPALNISGYIISLLLYVLRTFIVPPIDSILDYLHGYFSNLKPNPYLSGNYAPVETELTSFNLPISHGAIPHDLVGEFVRNGPNPKFVPRGGYHWFDGDGMLHGVRLSLDGTVSYINRFTKTKSLLAETKAGRPLRTRIGEMHGKLGLVKVLFSLLKKKLEIIPYLGGTANTALVFHNKKLQALVESDVPYEIRVFLDGQFETAARMEYDGNLRGMTAHPKVDPVTNEMFFFSYSVFVEPHLMYGYIDKTGNLVRTMPVNIPEIVMMHDFAITEKYAVFLDFSITFNKRRVIAGDPFKFDPLHEARIGVLDRYAKNADGMIWFGLGHPAHVFHTANAWEEGDEVVLVASRSTRFNISAVSTDVIFELVEWRCNLATREVKEVVICPNVFVEFPRIHPNFTGRKNQFVYAATGALLVDKPVNFEGIAKVDLQDASALKIFVYGDNKFGGEPVFVPKQNASSEDDGYLMTFVYDENKRKSSFWIIDAKSMSDIIAIVDLPQRVPYGFHGLFVSEEELQSQRLN